MEIVHCHVDERLVHGRILNDWIPHINPSHLIIADDDLVNDTFMSSLYKALAPICVHVHILSLPDSIEFIRKHAEVCERAIILARSPIEFEYLFSRGLPLKTVTLADKMYFPNKLEVPPSYRKALRRLFDMRVPLVAQSSPGEPPMPIDPRILRG